MFKLLRFILEFIENFTFFPLLIKMHSSLEKLNGSQYKNEYSDVHLTLMTYCWAVDMPQKLMGHETGVHVLTPWWIGVVFFGMKQKITLREIRQKLGVLMQMGSR